MCWSDAELGIRNWRWCRQSVVAAADGSRFVCFAALNSKQHRTRWMSMLQCSLNSMEPTHEEEAFVLHNIGNELPHRGLSQHHFALSCCCCCCGGGFGCLVLGPLLASAQSWTTLSAPAPVLAGPMACWLASPLRTIADPEPGLVQHLPKARTASSPCCSSCHRSRGWRRCRNHW